MFSGKKRICINKCHTSRSSFKVDDVPIEYFARKTMGDLYLHCKDCRDVCNVSKKRAKEKQLLIKVPETHFRCVSCQKILERNLIGKNRDGSDLKSCQSCSTSNSERQLKKRDYVRVLQLERIFETGVSCQVLNEIHLKPSCHTYLIDRIPVVNGIVMWNGMPIDSKIFVRVCRNELEFRHLQCDHIPKEEWDIKFPDIPWRKKHSEICRINNIQGQREEFSKCQLVSQLGHIIATNKRVSNNPKKGSSKARKLKLSWCNNYKSKNKNKCDLCKVIYEHYPCSFMHFDHIDINHKTDTISRMIIQKKYSLDDLINEITKCRLICGHCHKLVTDEQFKSGMIQDKIFNTKKRRKVDVDS